MTRHASSKREILIRFDDSDKIVALLDNGTLHEVQLARSCCGGDAAAASHDPEHQQKSNPASLSKDLAEQRRILARQIVHALCALFTIVLLEGALELIWFREDPDLLERYAPWLFYLDLTVVSLVATIGYLRTYRYAQTNHMTGMMIGMTVGMQVGMMTGGVIGATDGYFFGAMVGVLLGTFLGVATSWCCGPMAITQGLMSGVMGGTMGAMVVAMMPPEKLGIFMPLFTVLNLAILGWFVFLFFRDCVVGEHCELLKPMRFGTLLGMSGISIGVLSGLMLINPHTAAFQILNTEASDISPFGAQEFIPRTTKAGLPDMKCGHGMICGARNRRHSTINETKSQ
jgi:hypothetical protein